MARIAGLYRHPVKGFTPEAVDEAVLTARQIFPCDRLYAIEVGPSGFDPGNPQHISKQKFAVLAKSAVLSRCVTRFDDADSVFTVTWPDGLETAYALETIAGQDALAHDLAKAFPDEFQGELKVLQGPDVHRFTDHPLGQLSLLNLASLDAVSSAFELPVEASRFRMNVHLEGLEAWAEDNWQEGDHFRLGEAELSILSPTVRCKATHANPKTGAYDLNTVPELFKHFERNTFGMYALVTKTGTVRIGDALEPIAS